MDRTVILAADRRARCAVEVPAKPEPAEKTAGEELAHYIGKLAGAPIGLHHGERCGAPLRLLVGARARDEIGDRLMGARRAAETYHRTRDQDHLKRLARERDAIVVYIAANRVDGAYHLGGIGGQRGKINNFLLGHLWGIERI